MTTLGSGTLGSGTLGNPLATVTDDPWARVSLWIDGRAVPSIWTDPNWDEWVRIDLTNRIRSVAIRRLGAPDVWTAPEPSEMVLTLDNANGFLDPTFPGSPYNSLLTKGRQIRFVDDESGGYIMHALVTRWPVRWVKAGFDAATTLVCLDRLSALNRPLPDSLVEYELARGVKYSRPDHLWPMKETRLPIGATVVDVIGGANGTVVGGMRTPGSADLVPFSENGGIEAQGYNSSLTADSSAIRVPNSVIPARTVTFTALGVYRTSAQTDSRTYILSDARAGNPRFALGAIDNIVTCRFVNDNATVVTTNVELGEGDVDSPHILGGVYLASGPNASTKVFLDVGSYASGAIEPNRQNYSGDWMLSVGTVGAVAMVCIWKGVEISADVLRQINADMREPWVTDSPATRMSKIFALVAPDGSLAITGLTSTSMLPVRFGQRALKLLGEMAVLYGARLYCNRDGRVKFQADQSPILRTYASEMTINIEVADTPADVDSVKIANLTGNEVEIGGFDGRQVSLSEAPVPYDQLPGVAQRLLDYATNQPLAAVSSITILPEAPGVGYRNTLALDLYDRINVAYRRPWDEDFVEEREIYGIDHDTDSRYRWITTLHLRTPA